MLLGLGIYFATSHHSLHADPSAEELQTHYHALLVGVPNTGRNAMDQHIEAVFPLLAELLTRKYGFKVQLLLGHDTTLANIEKSLRDYVEQLSSRDSLLVVYAGATEMDEFLEESYWVTAPADGSGGLQRGSQNWFSCSRVLKYISAMNARHVLLVNDGDFVWNKQRGITLQGRPDADATLWYRKVASQPSRQILKRPMSGDVDTLLASNLLRMLVEHDSDFIAAAEISLYYRDLTGDPDMEFGRLHDYKGSMQGDFVFNNQLRENAAVFLEDWGLPLANSMEQGRNMSSAGLNIEPDLRTNRDLPDGPPSNTPSTRHLSAVPGSSAILELDEIGAFSDDLILENFGCERTYDSMVGEAMRFGDRSYLKLQHSKFRSLAAGDFTIAFWFKPDRLEAFPLIALSTLDRGLGISCASDGYLTFSCSGPSRTAHWRSIQTLEPLMAGKWYFVTLSKEGQTLSATLNKTPQGSFTEDYITFSDNSDEIFLGTQSGIEGSPITFEGVIDELKVFETVLSGQQIDALYAEKYQRFGVSPTYATDSEDLDKIARMSFGPRAKMADWRDLVNLFEGECESFMDAIGLEHWETAFVRCDGKRIWKDNRHYLATRHSGTARDYYLVHETLDEHQLDLGSWFQTNCKVIIQKY